MSNVRFEKATLEHAAALAAVMRPADALEVMSATGEKPLEALERGVRCSYVCITAFFDDEIAAMFGLSRGREPSALGERIDCCWFLTGKAVDWRPRTFVRVAKQLQKAFLEVHSPLFNWVDERYAGAKWLLRHLGAHLSEPVPYGVNKELFRLAVQWRR